MIAKPLRTIVIGFGKMSSTYANDPVMAKYYRYATHAQVLVDNPDFEWLAVVDPLEAARLDAKIGWAVPFVAENLADIKELAAEIDVAVLATPPESRMGIIDALPNLRAVLVEKPLGRTLKESAAFLAYCRSRNIQVQVNFWRRADHQFQQLGSGGLSKLIGETQLARGVYGNGLMNNGVHLIDFTRMLLGEVVSVEPLGQAKSFVEGPIPGDLNRAFSLNLSSGVVVPVQPVRFANYREVGLEIWGEQGHLSILNEGLTIGCRTREPNRGMSDEFELPFDKPSYLESTVGEALFRMYEDLAQGLKIGSTFCSTGDSALRTSLIVEAIQHSVKRKEVITIADYLEEFHA